MSVTVVIVMVVSVIMSMTIVILVIEEGYTLSLVFEFLRSIRVLEILPPIIFTLVFGVSAVVISIMSVVAKCNYVPEIER